MNSNAIPTLYPDDADIPRLMPDPYALCWKTVWNSHAIPPGLEHLVLTGRVASSVIIAFDDEGEPFRLSYRLEWDEAWRLKRADLSSVSSLGERFLSLESDRRGSWWDGEGRPLDILDGCLDIDIWPTPFTNSFPIRREQMEVGARRLFRMAWVVAPALTVKALPQAYTRVTTKRYLYESLDDSGFSAELVVDDQGLVIDYPGLFRRVGAAGG